SLRPAPDPRAHRRGAEVSEPAGNRSVVRSGGVAGLLSGCGAENPGVLCTPIGPRRASYNLTLRGLVLGPARVGAPPRCDSEAQLLAIKLPACSPHSFWVASSHHQRPSRSCWLGSTGRVQGSQPMLTKPRSCRLL